MRKLGVLIILVLVLIAIILFNTTQPQGTVNKAESDFAVADTALINKIYVADKGDLEVLLERKENNRWLVNNKYTVRKGAIDLLLETIKRLRVKHPVADAAHDNVIRNMAGKAKKVEIYQKGNEQPVKTYYIGGTDLEKTANYMLLDGEEQPYAMHIPGFTGYISGRYILKEIDWRDRTIFALRPENIKRITLQYPMEPQNGFRLSVVDQQNFVLQGLTIQNEKPIPLKPADALNYLQAFRFLACEAFLEDYTRTDSLLQQSKKNILTVELNDGKKQELSIYYIPVNKRSKTQFNQAGERVAYDVDRYYATQGNSKEVLLIQEYVFGKVLNTLGEMQQFGINPPLKKAQPNESAAKKPGEAKNKVLQPKADTIKPAAIKKAPVNNKPNLNNKAKPVLKKNQIESKKPALDTVINKQAIQPKPNKEIPNKNVPRQKVPEDTLKKTLQNTLPKAPQKTSPVKPKNAAPKQKKN